MFVAPKFKMSKTQRTKNNKNKDLLQEPRVHRVPKTLEEVQDVNNCKQNLSYITFSLPEWIGQRKVPKLRRLRHERGRTRNQKA